MKKESRNQKKNLVLQKRKYIQKKKCVIPGKYGKY